METYSESRSYSSNVRSIMTSEAVWGPQWSSLFSLVEMSEKYTVQKIYHPLYLVGKSEGSSNFTNIWRKT